jgi:hypothetical protein
MRCRFGLSYGTSDEAYDIAYEAWRAEMDEEPDVPPDDEEEVDINILPE